MKPEVFERILGRSVQERPIQGIFFGPEMPERLDTLLVGAFHGDEGISVEILKRLADRWCAGLFFREVPDFRTKPALIIPVLNPDGLAARTRVNANGVDLNRNYPTPDWQEENAGTPYYSGPSAASEPETRIMASLIERYQPAKIISVHSPYRVINFDGPAQALAGAVAAESGYSVVESIGYPTPGSFGTYAGVLRNIPVITLELPPGPDDPPDPEFPALESVDAIWRDNGPALEAGFLL